MLKRFFTFLRHPTSTAVIINTLGNYLNVVFSVFFVYLLVRIISPAQYGVFSVLSSISYVFANILDFGVTASLYSYLPLHLEGDMKRAYKLIKSTFFYQTLLSSVCIALLIVLFPWADSVFFKTNAPYTTLLVTAFSVLFYVWQNYLANCLYAAKRVMEVNLYSLAANVIKMVLIFVLIYFRLISVGVILFMFGIVGPTIFFFFVYRSKKNHMASVLAAPIDTSEFRIRYTFTNFIGYQLLNVGLRMDLFLISFFRPKNEVGYYGLAQKIILTIITTTVSITQVISPAFARIKSKKDVFPHVKSGVLYMLIPTAIFAILSVTPAWIFNIVFTHSFGETAQIAHLLGVAYLLYPVISLFQLFLLYSAKKPKYNLYANALVFIIVTGGCYFFIPYYGVRAAAISIASAFVLSTGLLAYFSLTEYKKLV